MDNVSAFLGLIKKAGKLEVGEEPVGASCRAKKAYLVITASDAAPNSIRRAEHFAEAGKTPVLPVSLDKEQLGRAIGRPPCSMISINDVGFAASLAKKLVAVNPELDELVSEQLAIKSARTMQRRKEKRAHEKNLLRGKKKPRLSRIEGEKKS